MSNPETRILWVRRVASANGTTTNHFHLDPGQLAHNEAERNLLAFHDIARLDIRDNKGSSRLYHNGPARIEAGHCFGDQPFSCPHCQKRTINVRHSDVETVEMCQDCWLLFPLEDF